MGLPKVTSACYWLEIYKFVLYRFVQDFRKSTIVSIRYKAFLTQWIEKVEPVGKPGCDFTIQETSSLNENTPMFNFDVFLCIK